MLSFPNVILQLKKSAHNLSKLALIFFILSQASCMLTSSTQVEKELLAAKMALDTLAKEADKNQIPPAWR